MTDQAEPRGQGLVTSWKRAAWTPHGPSVLVAVLVAINLGYRWLISLPGYFWQDDFYITAWAEQNPLDSWYLFLPFSDHFQPLGFALAWVCQRLFPGSYAAGMLWTAVIYAVSIWVFYRLLVRLYGWRPQFYLLMLLWGFSIFTVQSYLWYAASLYLAPYLLLVPLALWAAVVYLEDPRAWRLIVVLCTSAGAALAHTFGAIVPALTAALIIAMRLGSSSSTSWWRALGRQWLLIAVQAIPVVMVAVFYLMRSSSGRGVTLEPLEGLLFIFREFVWVIIPGLAGGPWRYNGYLSPEFPLLTPLAVMLAVQFIVLLVLLARIKPRAFTLWILMIVVVAGQLASVTLGRGGGDTSLVIRYAAPALIPLALAVSYTIASRPSETDPWRGWGGSLADWWRELKITQRGIVIVIAAQAYLISFSISLSVPVFETPFALNRTYMTELIGSSKSVPRDAALLPQFVPNRVVGVNAPGPTSTQLVLANLPSTPRFVDSVSGPLWGFTEGGDLVQQRVWGVEPRSRSDADCVTRLRGEPVVIPLQERAELWYATVGVGALAPEPSELIIELLDNGQVDGVARMTIPAGLERTYSGLQGAGDALRISSTGSQSICVTDMVVGERFHVNDGEWIQDPSTLPTQSFGLDPARIG